MPTDRELIESLRDGFENLQFRDNKTLTQLKDSGRMRVARVFGEESNYSSQFRRIGFHPPFAPTTEEIDLDWWRSAQTRAVSLLNTMLEELDLDEALEDERQETTEAPKSESIFVVHGHDPEMRESVARTLDKVKLDPIILQEQPNSGRTVIEKFSDYSNVGFAVVLLSPDDIGYSNADGPESAMPRARQNVILELGYFLGKLGRGSVVALHRGGIEIPSDYVGVLYTTYDDYGAWQGKLVKELQAAGYDVSADDL